MSRRTKQLSISKHCVDITLEQYANSKSTTNRLKKSHLGKPHREELDWFDCDVSDYDDDVPDVTPRCATLPCRGGLSGADSDGGQAYPLDLWFTLSNYIPPEDVGKFALLCRDAYYVTGTVSFYKRLWGRHKPRRESSPTTRAVCRNVSRSHAAPGSRGYRANVIRALYYVHPRFVDTPANRDLHSLEGTQCVMQWHQLFRRKCVFNFKMRFPPPPSCPGLAPGMNEDLWWNPEDSCCILQIVCENFIDLSNSQMGGLTLTKCHVTVSADMMRHKVKLLFHDTRRQLKPLPLSKYKEANAKALVLSPVLHYQVHHWWSQTYNFRNIKDSYR